MRKNVGFHVDDSSSEQCIGVWPPPVIVLGPSVDVGLAAETPKNGANNSGVGGGKGYG